MGWLPGARWPDQTEVPREPRSGLRAAPAVDIVERLAADGCDAVVLGCTELPLILDDAHSPLLALDSTRLLARAALHAAA
jgi:aspartate/glutamate racemase